MDNATVPDGPTNVMPHTIVAMVKDKPGVLTRVVQVWQERGLNIRSLAVGSSEQSGMSRLTFVVEAGTDAADMVRELRALDEVTDIRDISGQEFVSRELALIRVTADKDVRKRLMDIVDVFNAKVIDVSADSMIIEVTGHEQKIDSLARLLKDYDVVQMVRTGRVSMVRGKRD